MKTQFKRRRAARRNSAQRHPNSRTARRKPDHRPAPHNGGPQTATPERVVAVEGLLDLHPDGYGFLREPANQWLPRETDVFVPAALIQQLDLRVGDHPSGAASIRGSERERRLTEVTAIEGRSLEERPARRDFHALTPINPESRIRLETGREPLTTRVIDLFAPLGKGQRGVIVAPPRSGKTVLLQHIGQAIGANYPEIELIVLLVDERPEEVTEMRRKIPGTVFASSLDRDAETHVRLARLVVERCQRLAEQGKDVVLLIDSLTRMARAFNKRVTKGGRTMSGGLDIRALDVPKKLFASARAFAEGGSLTILATALIETGSRMDDVIFEEFKGTGNLELTLDRSLADRRIWPAIDLDRSGTRREEKLFDPAELEAMTALRRALSTMHPAEAMQQLTAQLARHESNGEFLRRVARRAAA